MLIDNVIAVLFALVLLLLFLWPREKGECSPPPKRYKAGCGCSTCECNGESQTRKENKR